MKGSEDFRIKSQSYVQFQNEILMYDKILPFFKRYLRDKPKKFNPENWTPKTFISTYFPGDEGKPETCLIQENIKFKQFYTPQDLYLSEQHFDIMIDYLAQLHSVSLALKISNDTEFASILKQLTPLCFEDPSGLPCLYDVLYDIALTRFFKNVSGSKYHDKKDEKFLQDVKQLQKVVGSKPVKLLDRFREVDQFAVIVHGDFNRNNLMFKCDPNGSVLDMRMIDFQQVRYGSPCLDLGFFMYLNIDPVVRPKIWNQLLKTYHEKLISYTAEILNRNPIDVLFDPYNYNNFLAHCQKQFLYGTIISVSFTPWLLTTKEETEKVSKLFQADMFDENYRVFALVVGGEKADQRMVEDMRHASLMGYLDILH